MKIRIIGRWLSWVVLSLLPVLAHAVDFVVTVGSPAAGCQYTDLQNVINNVVNGDVDIIHVQKGYSTGPITIPQGKHYMQIIGGFADCRDTSPDPGLDNGPTTLDGSLGGGGQSVLWVREPLAYVVLQNLVIQNGSNPAAGGGIHFESGGCTGDFQCGIELHNVRVLNNRAQSLGGGIYINGGADPTVLILDGVSVAFNAAGNAGSAGGGIHFGGTGYMTVVNSVISSNQADYGGGINMDLRASSTHNPELELQHDTLIFSNRATNHDGGGIRIAGKTRLKAEAPNTMIYYNVAGGWGGGIDVLGPAQANIAATGLNGLGVIYQNQATNGGGIAVHASPFNDGEEAYVNVYGLNPQFPARIQENVATNVGGAVYLRPYYNFNVGFDAKAYFFARDFMIDGNIAANGAAVFQDTDTGFLNLTADTIVGLGTGFRCAPGVRCNVVEHNKTAVYDSGSGQYVPTQGAVFLKVFGDLNIDSTRIVSNEAGRITNTKGEDFVTGHRLTNTIIAHNALSQDVLRADDDTTFTLDSCTVVDNAIDTDHVLSSGSTKTSRLWASIIAQPGTQAYSGSTNALDATFLLADDLGALFQNGTLGVGAPRFVNREAGDYHLRHNSLGVDAALDRGQPTNGDPVELTRDLDGNPRVRLLGTDASRPRDLGAYELQSRPTDVIFANSFD